MPRWPNSSLKETPAETLPELGLRNGLPGQMHCDIPVSYRPCRARLVSVVAGTGNRASFCHVFFAIIIVIASAVMLTMTFFSHAWGTFSDLEFAFGLLVASRARHRCDIGG